jgi:hypothetical protein
MIISHRHRFIFIKTTKTAGTSIEVFLAQCCGDDDVVTPFGVAEAGHVPRNHEAYYNHMAAAEVRQQVGEEVWRSYFKFCFERNPWDKVVSMYYFTRGRHGQQELAFDDFVRRRAFPIDHPKYLIDGRLAVDFVGRYETLATDLTDVCARLGLPVPVLPRAKGQYREGDSDFQPHYDAELAAIVADAYRWEIDRFGYCFGEAALADGRAG